jgi:hypothetical protein
MQDDLDAANKVVRSRADIRQVLIDFDNKNASKLFGNGSACPTKPCSGTEQGLDENGSPIVMQQEMEKEMASATTGSNKKGKKSAAGAGGSKSVKKEGGGGAKKSGGTTTAKKGKK